MKYLSLWLACFAFGQELSLEQIMADPVWMGELPEAVKISRDNKTVFFRVPRPIPLPDKWMRLSLADQGISEAEGDALPLALARAVWSNGTHQVYEIEGDFWVGKGEKPPQPAVSRKERLSFVRFLGPDAFAFREGDHLFSYGMSTGRLVQLTNLQMKEESEEKDTFYTIEEKKMFEFIEDRYQREAFDEKDDERKRRLGSLRRPPETFLGKDMAVGEIGGDENDRFMLDISPDLLFAVVCTAPKEDGDPTEYAEIVTKEGDVKMRKARARVGRVAKTWKLASVNLDNNDLKWLDLSGLPDIGKDPLADIKESLTEEEKALLPKAKEGPRPVTLIPGGFQPGGTRFLVTVITDDYKDKWIVTLDPATMEWELVVHLHDPAWVQYFLRGSGTSHSVMGSAFWRQDGKKIMLVSDHSGYQHLYAYDPADKTAKALTEGNFEIYDPYEGPDGKSWYFHSNKAHPGEMHFYRMPLEGGAWTAFTEEPGQHSVEMSADGTLMAELFSRTNQPPVVRLKNGKKPWQTVYDGASREFRDMGFAQPPVITYENRDGKPVYARLYLPSEPNGAGIVFVHGAGYLQNAHKGWSGYFREYMFHNLLMREGYTVLDPDYQASAGYGRDWRTAIYRHMGGKDLNDIVDGAEFLIQKQGVDPNRLGLYGGSYGGFITLMAMFTTPDVFKAGAALRPVTDWAYYNHWYTSRILNTPVEDPLAYRRSSPIYFAEGLKGRLLICHGMVDANVHYQDSVRLAQKLIELHKHDWELSSYPVEGHGFRTASSWYDEYRRIYELFHETLGNH